MAKNCLSVTLWQKLDKRILYVCPSKNCDSCKPRAPSMLSDSGKALNYVILQGLTFQVHLLGAQIQMHTPPPWQDTTWVQNRSVDQAAFCWKLICFQELHLKFSQCSWNITVGRGESSVLPSGWVKLSFLHNKDSTEFPWSQYISWFFRVVPTYGGITDLRTPSQLLLGCWLSWKVKPEVFFYWCPKASWPLSTSAVIPVRRHGRYNKVSTANQCLISQMTDVWTVMIIVILINPANDIRTSAFPLFVLYDHKMVTVTHTS